MVDEILGNVEVDLSPVTTFVSKNKLIWNQVLVPNPSMFLVQSFWVNQSNKPKNPLPTLQTLTRLINDSKWFCTNWLTNYRPWNRHLVHPYSMSNISTISLNLKTSDEWSEDILNTEKTFTPTISVFLTLSFIFQQLQLWTGFNRRKRKVRLN